MENIEHFIVKAKANGWVGIESGGMKISSSRRDSLDIVFVEGNFFYQDSFVGISDFCGQEHICYKTEAVWSQVYYGRIYRPDLIDSSKTVEVLKAALGAMYREGRFLGAFDFFHGDFVYHDQNNGDYSRFAGNEEIRFKDEVVYHLQYFGGLVRK